LGGSMKNILFRNSSWSFLSRGHESSKKWNFCWYDRV